MLSSPIAVLALKLMFSLLALVAGSRFIEDAERLRSPEGLRGLGGALAGMLVGAKAGFLLQYPQLLLFAEPGALWLAVGGLSVPGACAGGALGLMLSARARATALAGELLPALLVALLVLDLGALTWALTEPGFGAAARRGGINFGDGIERHPVMLYDAAAMLLLLWAARRVQAAVLEPGVRVALVGAACFGVWFLLGFLKPPFGPVLMLEAVYPRPMLYSPGFTGEQWLCLLALPVLGWGYRHKGAR